MIKCVPINKDGSVKLPEQLRAAAHWGAASYVLAKVEDGKIVLRTIDESLIEEYTEERIAEFVEDDPYLAQKLAELDR